MTNTEIAEMIVYETVRILSGIAPLVNAMIAALDEAEKRGEDIKQREWEAWHLKTFGHTITERALDEAELVRQTVTLTLLAERPPGWINDDQ